MKQKTKKILKKKVIKIIKIGFWLLIIFTIYSMGVTRGLITGIALSQEKEGKSLCEFMNKTRDVDGFCLLTEEKYRYRIYLDCGYEKFKVRGEKKPPLLFKVAEDIRKIIYYPALGC